MLPWPPEPVAPELTVMRRAAPPWALCSPLDVRREALEDTYGFVCGCGRCREESKLSKDLQQLIADIYDSCTSQVGTAGPSGKRTCSRATCAHMPPNDQNGHKRLVRGMAQREPLLAARPPWPQVREELEEAIEEEDTSALESLRDQLAAYVEVLDAAFAKTKIAEKAQGWVQVSAAPGG